jgi:polysaccharide export outer membrane protein
MTIKRITYQALLIVTSAVLLSSCSTLVPSGMPTIGKINSPKLAKPIAGRDYTLIPITYNTISKNNIASNRYTKKVKRSSVKKARGTGGYKYLIGAHDILSITVWDHPELTIPAGEFRDASSAGHKVGENGKFFFPFAGEVQAKGRTTNQIRKELEKKLAKFITKPQVGVAIASYRSQKTSISGEISKPGVFIVNDTPKTVRSLIAEAGGLTKDASYVALLVKQNRKININLNSLYRGGNNSQNYVLRGGDALHIVKKNTSRKVFVMGEVRTAGSIKYDEFGLTLAEAISEAGSFNEETADPTGVFVVRQQNRNDKKPTVYQLQMTSVHSVLFAERFKLHPRDIVYVTATPVVRWNRLISRLLPSISTLDSFSDITRRY